MVIKQAELTGLQKPLIAAQDAHSFPVMLSCGFCDRTDNRVEPRAIAPTRHDSNFLVHSVLRLFKRHRYCKWAGNLGVLMAPYRLCAWRRQISPRSDPFR